MKDEADFLSLFEGLNPQQVKELREQIVPTLQQVREKITNKGENNMQAPEKLGNFPEWTPADGPAPFVFADRPAGQRCAWSCHWTTRNPKNSMAGIVVTPEDWGMADPGKMTPEQVAAELEDNFFDMLLTAQPFGGVGMEKMFDSTLDLHVTVKHNNNPLIQSLLTGFRQGYARSRTYVSPYDAPEKLLLRTSLRPGWR